MVMLEAMPALPDMIFLDINTPTMDAKSCLKAIKKDKRYDAIPTAMKVAGLVFLLHLLPMSIWGQPVITGTVRSAGGETQPSASVFLTAIGDSVALANAPADPNGNFLILLP